MARARPGWLLAVLLVAIAFPARAHSLYLFATAEADALRGRVYFSGGGAAGGVPVVALGADGASQGRVLTADDGRFVLPVPPGRDYRLVAETADGHRAEFPIAAAEWPAGAASTPPPRPVDDPAVGADSTPKLAPAPAAEPADGLAARALIEAAVARQLAPLREQLAAFEAETRWRDVLGGIGYILGLTGIAAFLLARRRPRAGTDGPGGR